MKVASFFVLAVLSAGLFTHPALLAQSKTMYKWVDENGVVHFSDRKPPEVQAQQEAVPTMNASSGPNPYAAATPASEQAEARRQEIAEKNEAARAQQQELNAKCSAWRSELSRIEPTRRVFYKNEAGETVRMDDEVRVQRVDLLKQSIADHCD